MAEVRLSLRDASARFVSPRGTVHAVSGVDLDVRDGELLCILGPSGCGKSTLLGMLGGFIPPSAGDVLLDDRRLTAPDPSVVTMFQDPGLFPWRSVLGNVEFALAARGVAKADRRETAEEYLRLVGLGEHAHKHPHELSGGMRQRASIARALAVHPSVLLMDEPFGALDAITRMRMQEELVRLWQNRRCTIVFVTHDVDEAVYLADRIVIMTPCPGRIADAIEVSSWRPRPRDSAEAFELRTRILRALHLADEAAAVEYSI